MRRFQIILLSLSAFIAAGVPSVAAQPNVVEVDSVDTLHLLATLTSTVSVHLASYHCASSACSSDGGQGLLVWYDTGCDASNTNGGSTFYDAAGNCWRRANLNGDLRQWGITAESNYDAGAHPTTVLGVTNLINTKVIPAMTAAGLHAIHTGQVSIKIDYDLANHQTLILPSGWSFTCDAPPVKQADNADYRQLPGSLILAHGSGSTNFLDANTFNDVEVHDCAAVLPEWYINPSKADDFLPDALKSGGGTTSIYDSFTVPAAHYSDLEAIRADMIMAGDMAIKAGQGAHIHDIAIMGFDNGLDADNAPSFLGRNVYIDGSIGAFFTNNGGGTTVHDFLNNPYLTRQAGVPNEEYFSIDNVQRDVTTGECQLKLKAVLKDDGTPRFSLDDITNSIADDDMAFGRRGDPIAYPAWVTGLNNVAMSCLSKGTGRFGNDAAWAVRKVGDDSGGYQLVDLVGSQYTSTRGASPEYSVQTTADWSANSNILRITGSVSNLTVGMQVTSGDSSWPQCSGMPCPLTVTAIVERATGPDPNDGYNGEVVVSQAIAAASGGASLNFYSVSDPPPTGSIGTCGGTADTPCFFYNAAERYVSGASPAGNAIARLPSSRGGHLGAGFLLDNISGFRSSTTVSFAHYYNIATADAEECVAAQAKGDENGELTPANSVGIYVSGQSRGCDFITAGPGQKGASLVQDTFGRADQTLYATGTASLDGYHSGTITGIAPAVPPSWPDRGELHMCKEKTPDNLCDVGTPDAPKANEIVAYTKTSGTSVAVNVRSRFGTSPVDWSTISGSVYLYWTKISNGSDRHDDKSASTIFDALSAGTISAGNAFEIHHGGATLQNVRTTGTASGTGFVSTNTSGVNVIGAGLPGTSLIFEDGNAQFLTTITPDSQFYNFAPPGAANLPMTLLNPGGVTLHANGFSDLGTYSLGVLNLTSPQTTAGWPINGVLLAGNEEMAFALDPDITKIDITARGVCGTTAATHGNSDIKFLLVELPCGAAGLKGYASNGFTVGSPTSGDPGAGALSTENRLYENSGQTVPGIVCSSGSTHAAGTTETLLASCKIPGGVMGLNGCVSVDAFWDWSTTGTKTIKAYANAANSITGGTAYLSSTFTSTTSSVLQRTIVKICNRNSASSQVGGALSGNTAATTGTLPTSTIDTGSDWYVVFSGVRTSGAGDSLALEQYQVQNQPF